MKPIPLSPTARPGPTRVTRALALAVTAAFLGLNASADPLNLHPGFTFAAAEGPAAQFGADRGSGGYGNPFNDAWDFDRAGSDRSVGSYDGDDSQYSSNMQTHGFWFSRVQGWGFQDFSDYGDGKSNQGGWQFGGNDGTSPVRNRILDAGCNDSTGGTSTASVPDGSSTLVLLGSALATLLAFGRRFFSPA